MKVTLIDYTGKGMTDPARYAASVLLFTKSTRLQMKPNLFEEIQKWSDDHIRIELEYMANTIPSSWEFVDFTFLIEGVTRAFTHQFVRSRHWSFAQQTMRVLDVSDGPGWDYLTGPSIIDAREAVYSEAMKDIAETYSHLIAMGAKIEDARGILPTNILTNIVGKCNMRSFVELVRKRSSPRVQGEYREALKAMEEAATAVYPWLSLFIDRTFERAARDLDVEIAAEPDEKKRIRMMKLVDQMRAQS